MRRALILLLLLACCALAARLGLPWYVNSGRARPVLEAVLRDRIGGDVHLGTLAMRKWLVLVVDDFAVTRPGLGRVTGAGLTLRASTLGLLLRRFKRLEAERLAIVVARGERRPDATRGAPWLAGGRAPVSVQQISLPDVTVTLGGAGAPVAQARLAATRVRGDEYALDMHVTVPAVDLTLEGTARYALGFALPEAATLRVSADWGRLVMLAGRPELHAAGRITGTLETVAGITTLRAQHPGLAWAGVQVGAGEIRLAARQTTLALPIPLDLRLTVDRITRSGYVTTPGPVQVRAAAEVHLITRRLTWRDAEIAWDAGVVLRSAGSAVLFTENRAGQVEVALPELPIAQWAGYVPPVAALLARVHDASGTVGGTIRLTWGDAAPVVAVDLRGGAGSVTLGEFRQAAGFGFVLASTAVLEPGVGWRVAGAGTVRPGEVLWHAYYQDFTGREVPCEFAVRVGENGAGLTAWHVRADLGGFGQWQFRKDPPAAGGAPAPLHVTAHAVDVAPLLREVVLPLVQETRPWTADMHGRGSATFTARVAGPRDAWVGEGRLQLADVTVVDPTDRLGIEELTVDLPFRLGPGAEPRTGAPPQVGTVRFAALRGGGSVLDGATLPVRLWDNAAAVGAPYVTELFGGELRVADLHGTRLLSPARKWQAAVTLRHIDLESASQALGTLPLAGTLDADLHDVHLVHDSLVADGSVKATVYGGAVRLTKLSVEHVFSPYRTYGADADVDRVHLAPATAAFGFGRMSGVLTGTVGGLRIEAGQPAAFEAEFHTVRTRGVPQTVSIEAVDNISILGTGRGLSGMLARGLRGFFDSYKYDLVGFTCSLENDRFTIHGGTMGPAGEYFVKGTTLPPRINVIRRDSTGTISFSEMVRRFRGLRLQAAAPTAQKGSAS